MGENKHDFESVVKSLRRRNVVGVDLKSWLNKAN